MTERAWNLTFAWMQLIISVALAILLWLQWEVQ
jgi:hypothetical protein